MKNKKVFCRNCKWCQYPNWWGYEECWFFNRCYSREGKIYQEYVGKLEKDISMNKNNNCPHYKRKWWKWWA